MSPVNKCGRVPVYVPCSYAGAGSFISYWTPEHSHQVFRGTAPNETDWAGDVSPGVRISNVSLAMQAAGLEDKSMLLTKSLHRALC